MSFSAVNTWEAETRRSKYPFVETASLRDASGELVIDPAVIVECQLWPQMARGSRVYLSSIARQPGTLTLTFSSLDGELGSAVVRDLTKSRVAIRLGGDGAQIGFVRVAPGGFAEIHDNPSGTYRFAVSASELVASSVHPVPQATTSSLTAAGRTFTGSISLVAGTGVRFRQSGSQLIVDFVGDPYYARDFCRDPGTLGLLINPIRRIVVSDTRTSYTVVPLAGQVVVRVRVDSDKSPDQRSITSPGPNDELLYTMVSG